MIISAACRPPLCLLFLAHQLLPSTSPSSALQRKAELTLVLRLRSGLDLIRQLFLLQAGPLASRSSRPPQLADWQPAASRRSKGMYFLLKSGAILGQEPLQTGILFIFCSCYTWSSVSLTLRSFMKLHRTGRQHET